MSADEFYTLGKITIEEIDISSFEKMPKPAAEFVQEEVPLLEGVQGTIDGSPTIGKKNPLNIYDIYVLLTQGLQKKVTSLGNATKRLKTIKGKAPLDKKLKSNDYRLKVLAFTAEAVRQFLSFALDEEVLHIPQAGTLKPHGSGQSHPTGMAWDHGTFQTKPTFFFEGSKKTLPAKYVIAATAICIDQEIIKNGRLGMYESKHSGKRKIKQMHYDYILWRQESPNAFELFPEETTLMATKNIGWFWHYVRNQEQVKDPKKLSKGKYRRSFWGSSRKKMLLKAQKIAPDNEDIGDILKLYDQWSGVAKSTKIVTFDEYMKYLEENGSRWKFLANL